MSNNTTIPDRQSVGVNYLLTAEQFFIRRGVLRTPAGEHSSPLPCVRSMFCDFSAKNITLFAVSFLFSVDLLDPAEGILDLAPLDTGEDIVKLLGDLTDLAFAYDILLAEI